MLDIKGERVVSLIKTLIHYQTLIRGMHNSKEIIEVLETRLVNPNSGEQVMMSIAEFLEERGFEKGEKKGESAILLRQLQRKYGTIPLYYRKRIEKADANILLIWAEKILDADRIEEIFAEKVIV